jgi:hypothetical protein
MRDAPVRMLRTFTMMAALSGAAVPYAARPYAALPASSVVDNLTGLPTYPNLTDAAMDKVFKTETFGRWCARFTAATSDSLASVEAWYRKALIRASESDLAKDDRYKAYANLSGVKLAVGIDYVAVYRTSNQQTIIELHRCSWTQ